MILTAWKTRHDPCKIDCLGDRFCLGSPFDIKFVFDGSSFHILNQNTHADSTGWTFYESRLKFDKDVVYVSTGLVFSTPAGWCLRTANASRDAEIIETILEADSSKADLWVGIRCRDTDKVVDIKKGQPIAHLLPCRKEDLGIKWSVNIEANQKSCDNDRVKFESKTTVGPPEKTLEEQRREFKDPKSSDAQFFSVFDRDINRSLRIIGAKV